MPQDAIDIIAQWQSDNRRFVNQAQSAILGEAIKRANPLFQLEMERTRVATEANRALTSLRQERERLAPSEIQNSINKEKRLLEIRNAKMAEIDEKARRITENSVSAADFLQTMGESKNVTDTQRAFINMIQGFTPEKKISATQEFGKQQITRETAKAKVGKENVSMFNAVKQMAFQALDEGTEKEYDIMGSKWKLIGSKETVKKYNKEIKRLGSLLKSGVPLSELGTTITPGKMEDTGQKQSQPIPTNRVDKNGKQIFMFNGQEIVKDK